MKRNYKQLSIINVNSQLTNEWKYQNRSHKEGQSNILILLHPSSVALLDYPDTEKIKSSLLIIERQFCCCGCMRKCKEALWTSTYALLFFYIRDKSLGNNGMLRFPMRWSQRVTILFFFFGGGGGVILVNKEWKIQRKFSQNESKMHLGKCFLEIYGEE